MKKASYYTGKFERSIKSIYRKEKKTLRDKMNTTVTARFSFSCRVHHAKVAKVRRKKNKPIICEL